MTMRSGTWTPTLSQGNSWATSASFSYSTYVKIGSLVTVFTNMLTSGGSGNASAADALQVLGLPFTSSAVDAAAGTFWTSSNYNAGYCQKYRSSYGDWFLSKSMLVWSMQPQLEMALIDSQ